MSNETSPLWKACAHILNRALVLFKKRNNALAFGTVEHFTVFLIIILLHTVFKTVEKY